MKKFTDLPLWWLWLLSIAFLTGHFIVGPWLRDLVAR